MNSENDFKILITSTFFFIYVFFLIYTVYTVQRETLFVTVYYYLIIIIYILVHQMLWNHVFTVYFPFYLSLTYHLLNQRASQ